MLPQAASRLDTRPELVARRGPGRASRGSTSTPRPSASWPTKHDGDGDAVRAEVLDIVRTRGKMQNPVTGSGGMLIGTVEEVGPESPLGLARRRPASPRWCR